AEHFEKAWRLRPDRRGLLIDLARVKGGEGSIALLAASRSEDSRVAEEAQELLPARYPYVSEFQQAIRFGPSNLWLRHDLGYLYIEMNQQNDAEKQFQTALELAPDDLLAAAQLGLMRLARGDSAGAMPLLQRVLAGGNAELAAKVRAALRMPSSASV